MKTYNVHDARDGNQEPVLLEISSSLENNFEALNPVDFIIFLQQKPFTILDIMLALIRL